MPKNDPVKILLFFQKLLKIITKNVRTNYLLLCYEKRDHIFDDKLNQNCPFTRIVYTYYQDYSHRQVFQCSYFTLANFHNLNMNLALNC